ncbi:MAG TPA: ABC transporter substrate-binding protein [Acidimicrobiales bacterium]|nr:ABC transporter substrate-binding protein [Acidimicrobiales bacterium]
MSRYGHGSCARPRWRRGVVLVALLGVAAAACGDDNGSSPAGTDTSSAAISTTVAPQRGGTLTVGLFAELKSLDSVMNQGAGSAGGGNELGALYDRLLEWDPVANKYNPKTAESVTPNDDLTAWTIKLRPNIKFGDGTAYDAAAVKVHLERSKNPPAGSTGLAGALASISRVEVVDPLTVRIVLTEPWAQFPFMLTMTPGMVMSPTAVQKLGNDINTKPVGAGAGPFEFVSFKPGEGVVLKRNENYWNGEVYLDQLRFVTLAGGPATYQALKTGNIDVAFLRDAASIAQSKADHFAGSDTVYSSGGLILVNNGVEVTCKDQQPAPACAGKADGAKAIPKTPGQDLRVRQAIALALDVDVINQRLTEGTGLPARSLFDQSFPWDPKVADPKVDLDRAKKLVQEAKAAGWDGKIRLLCSNTVVPVGLAVEAMLKSVGMDVDTTKTNVEVLSSVADVITKKDFDVACWGYQLSPDDYGQVGLDLNLRSTSSGNRVGYKSAAMDAALIELKKARSDDAKKAVFKKIADLWVSDVPSVPYSHATDRLLWGAKVHGARTTSQASGVYDKVWLER